MTKQLTVHIVPDTTGRGLAATPRKPSGPWGNVVLTWGNGQTELGEVGQFVKK